MVQSSMKVVVQPSDLGAKLSIDTLGRHKLIPTLHDTA